MVAVTMSLSRLWSSDLDSCQTQDAQRIESGHQANHPRTCPNWRRHRKSQVVFSFSESSVGVAPQICIADFNYLHLFVYICCFSYVCVGQTILILRKLRRSVVNPLKQLADADAFARAHLEINWGGRSICFSFVVSCSILNYVCN